MTRLAIPLEDALKERLRAQATKLNLKPEELAVRAIRNILFLLEMRSLQTEIRPMLEKKGVMNEDDLYAVVS